MGKIRENLLLIIGASVLGATVVTSAAAGIYKHFLPASSVELQVEEMEKGSNFTKIQSGDKEIYFRPRDWYQGIREGDRIRAEIKPCVISNKIAGEENYEGYKAELLR